MKRKSIIAVCAVLGVVILLDFWRRPVDSDVVRVIPGEYMTNSIGMRLRKIEPGTFMMGPENGDGTEEPVHVVAIAEPFYIGVHEVTQEEYEQVTPKNQSGYKGSKLPVEVSWNDAVAFCEKLSEAEPGRTYRLPTEAEWEYCCRAGTTTEYYWGNEPDKRYAWTMESWQKLPPDWLPISPSLWPGKDDLLDSQPLPVGDLLPNAWGLYDMSGNVKEWCADWYGSRYYAESPEENPQGPAVGDSRVVRGGDWFHGTVDCRSWSRHKLSPTYPGSGGVGFRVVCIPSTNSLAALETIPLGEPNPRLQRTAESRR